MVLFLVIMALGVGMIVHVPAKTDSLLGETQQTRNTSSMWLHTPANNKKDRGSRKRKHAAESDGNGGLLSGEITLCWSNAFLRECKEVTISPEFYNILRDHHVGDVVECFCVTEGFDHFESQKWEPLYIDGRVFDAFPQYMVAKYSGDPLPHMGISFLDSSSGDTPEARGGTNAICWPNPLLGECKEADISQAEVTELLAGEYGDDLDIDMCSCASDGFTSAKTSAEDKNGNSEQRMGGVQTYSPPLRVTLCFFDGQTPDHDMWETDDNVKVQKGEICKQVTIDWNHYYSARSSRKDNFNNAGIFECQGGCPELGYSMVVPGQSTQLKHFRPTQLTGKAVGKRIVLDLIPHRYLTTSPGEWVYTYHTKEYSSSRVTLCYFVDGEEQKVGTGVDANSDKLWWRPTDGIMVRKRQFCKQVTMSRELYSSSSRAPGRKEKFNKYGIYECGEGGCDELGYGVVMGSNEIARLTVRLEKQKEGDGGDDAPTTHRIGKRHFFDLTPRHSKQRERVDTYYSASPISSNKATQVAVELLLVGLDHSFFLSFCFYLAPQKSELQ